MAGGVAREAGLASGRASMVERMTRQPSMAEAEPSRHTCAQRVAGQAAGSVVTVGAGATQGLSAAATGKEGFAVSKKKKKKTTTTSEPAVS